MEHANLITEQGNVLLTLYKYPILLVIYLVMFLIIIFAVIVIRHPALLEKLGNIKPRQKCNTGEDTKIQETMARRVDSIELLLEEDARKRYSRQAYVDGKFDDLDKKFQELAQLSAMNVIYSEPAPIWLRLKYAVLYFKAHGNGECLQFIIDLIKKNNARSLWRSALDEDRKQFGISDDKYFLQSLKAIERKTG